MWGQSIYSEDPLSPKLADEYGVVISTSHHEPMMRAHVEWKRDGGGEWNYATNETQLREFWKEGIKRMGNNESIVTLAIFSSFPAPGLAVEKAMKMSPDELPPIPPFFAIPSAARFTTRLS